MSSARPLLLAGVLLVLAACGDDAQRVSQGAFAAQGGGDAGDEVVDVGQVEDRRGIHDADTAGHGDPAEVVADEVDDHRQLGAVLGAGEKFAAGRGFSAGDAASGVRPRAG